MQMGEWTYFIPVYSPHALSPVTLCAQNGEVSNTREMVAHVEVRTLILPSCGPTKLAIVSGQGQPVDAQK